MSPRPSTQQRSAGAEQLAALRTRDRPIWDMFVDQCAQCAIEESHRDEALWRLPSKIN